VNDWGISFPVINVILLLGTINTNSAFVFKKHTIRVTLSMIGPNIIEQSRMGWELIHGMKLEHIGID
jgi:hypothetical protein